MSEDLAFLKELQKQMQYESKNDNDGQASPCFWVIWDYRNVPGNEKCDIGEFEHFYNDGNHVPLESFDALVTFLGEHFKHEMETDEELQELVEEQSFDDLWSYVEEYLNENGYFSRVFMKEEDFIVPDTMFITKEEAKSHLRQNAKHYTAKAHTYAMTAWRSPKVERLIRILSDFDWESVKVKPSVDEGAENLVIRESGTNYELVLDKGGDLPYKTIQLIDVRSDEEARKVSEEYAKKKGYRIARLTREVKETVDLVPFQIMY